MFTDASQGFLPTHLGTGERAHCHDPHAKYDSVGGGSCHPVVIALVGACLIATANLTVSLVLLVGQSTPS